MKKLKRVAETLLGSDTSPPSRALVGLLEPVLNDKFHSGPRPGNLRDSYNLIRQNVRDVGGYFSSLAVMTDLAAVLEERLWELESFRETYWNKGNRAPDYYARAIALWLARLLARETVKLPTTPITADTGDPSTQYSRALSEAFEILGFKKTQSGYATWSAQQMTENDLEPHSGIFGGILRPGIVPESDLLTTPSQGTASNESPLQKGALIKTFLQA